MIENLIHKLPTKMQTGSLVLEQIALKCLPEVERGIISSGFNTTAIEWKAAENKDEKMFPVRYCVRDTYNTWPTDA